MTRSQIAEKIMGWIPWILVGILIITFLGFNNLKSLGKNIGEAAVTVTSSQISHDDTPAAIVVPACSAGWVNLRMPPKKTVSWSSPVQAEYFSGGVWKNLAPGAHAPAAEGFRFCAKLAAYVGQPMGLWWR